MAFLSDVVTFLVCIIRVSDIVVLTFDFLILIKLVSLVTLVKGTAFQRFYHLNYCIIIRILVDTLFSVSFANFGCA